MQSLVNIILQITLSIILITFPNNNIPKKLEKEIMTIKIDKLNIERKIYEKNSKLNDIDKNVIIMKDSDYPDEDNSTVIIGAHSGTGSIAYFNDLVKIEKGDLINLFYKGKKYVYKVEEKHKDGKDGKIKIEYGDSREKLILYTCYPKDKSNYLVVTSYLQ